MRLFIINTFQSAADQLCPENDEDRWFFCIWLTRRRRLVYFAISAAWKKRSYAGEDGLSGFLFWVLLRDKKKEKREKEKEEKEKRLLRWFDFGLSDRSDTAQSECRWEDCGIRFIYLQEKKRRVKKGNEKYL